MNINSLATPRILLAASALALLSACADPTADRAVKSGAVGAGIGAVGSAILGGSVAKGAIVGGAVGAAGSVIRDSLD